MGNLFAGLGHLMSWLFTDPFSACVNATAASKICSGPVKLADGTTAYVEVFHFYPQWIIFSIIAFLIVGYYWAEGRKRFVKGRMPLYKSILDRMMRQLGWFTFLGVIILGSRYFFDSSFFAYRFWRYAWLAWAVGLAIYWVVYFIRSYARDREAWRSHLILSQYTPQPRKRGVAKAGSR
jgi:hypothetical protein